MNYHHTDGAVNVINGRDLRRIKKLFGAPDRALIAADLATGAARLENLPHALSAKLLGVSSGYVSTVSKASHQEVVAVICGTTTLSALHNRYRHQQPDDAAIERLVVKLGPDRVLRALDRMTAPEPVVLQAAE